MLALERIVNMRHVIDNLKIIKMILEARKSSKEQSLQKKKINRRKKKKLERKRKSKQKKPKALKTKRQGQIKGIPRL